MAERACGQLRLDVERFTRDPLEHAGAARVAGGADGADLSGVVGRSTALADLLGEAVPIRVSPRASPVARPSSREVGLLIERSHSLGKVLLFSP